MAPRGERAPCPYVHLEPGYYPAVNGTIAVPAGDHAQLVRLATNASGAIAEAVNQERQSQLQARADALTLQAEVHNVAIGSLQEQLQDARKEINDRGETIRTLIKERHDDVRTMGESQTRAIVAENKDKRLDAETKETELRLQLDALGRQLDHQLYREGFAFFGRLLGPVVPMLVARANSAKPSGPTVETTIEDLHADPPPLCAALCQFLWKVRDPQVVAALGMALQRLAMFEQLQGLGAALQEANPEGFAAVIAVIAVLMNQPEAAAPASAPSASTSSGGPTSAPVSTATTPTEPAVPTR